MIIKMKKIFKCIIRKNEYILSDDLFLIELYLTQRKISLTYKILEYSKKEVKKSFKGYNTYNENYAEEGNTTTLMSKISKELNQIPIVRINSEEVKVYKRHGYYN